MTNQMKSKHVLFKSRYITREYTPLGIHSLESAAHSKQFKPRSLTNWILPWKNKSEPDYTNASQEHCGNPSLKTKKVHAHPANKKRKELSHCLPSKFYARFTHGSHEHTSQLSVETKRVYAYPPLKKRVIYATGHPLQDLRKRYKGELTTLWSLLTENKKLHPNPQHNDLHNLVKMCEEQITISCPTLTLTETQEWEESYSQATWHHTRTKRFQLFLSSKHLSPIALKKTFIHKKHLLSNNDINQIPPTKRSVLEPEGIILTSINYFKMWEEQTSIFKLPVRQWH